MDAELLREIPGYKAILKAVLKSQIQMLVEQLSSQGEEESILLTASLSDGTLHHLGSLSGKNFLDGREEIKSQFLFHCLNGKSRNSHSDQEQIFVPQGMIPPEESYHQMARPAKKPRRTLPFPSGRGRKAQSQIRAGTGNLKRPRSAATVTRPAVSVVPVATETQTRTVPGHDLVTVKAEDFEWNIDLNAESGERVEAPVDNDQSDMDKTNHPKQGNISVPASTRRSFSSDKSDLNMNSSVGEVKVSDGCDVVEMLKDSVVPVKVELADEFERAGLESGASQGLYGGPGPSGDMDNSTWAPGVSEGMESFGSEAESLNASVDHGNQSSSKNGMEDIDKILTSAVYVEKLSDSDNEGDSTEQQVHEIQSEFSDQLISQQFTTGSENDTKSVTQIHIQSMADIFSGINRFTTESEHDANKDDEIQIQIQTTEETAPNVADPLQTTGESASGIIPSKKSSSKISKKRQPGWNSFGCLICQKTFKTKSYLQAHYKRHRDGVKKMVCEICGKSYASQTGMECHLKNHKGIFKYLCTYCGRGFNYKGDFMGHEASHTSEKCYKCDKCGKAFQFKNYLKSHAGSCGLKEGEFNCTLCNKKFKQKRYLSDHMKAHLNTERFQCSVCGNFFKHRATLYKHGKRTGH